MKTYLHWFVKLVVLVVPVFLLGAGDITVYFGTVRSVRADKVTVLLKDGSEKSCKVTDKTRSFVSGRLLPVTRIRPNSHVQIAVDGQDVCRQIVVEEAPK